MVFIISYVDSSHGKPNLFDTLEMMVGGYLEAAVSRKILALIWEQGVVYFYSECLELNHFEAYKE